MVDDMIITDNALIGKLYREMERRQTNSSLGMDDPDAIAYAKAYLSALDRPKHGNPIELSDRLKEAIGLK
jgi:hypothetical protein